MEKDSNTPVKAMSCSLCDEPLYEFNAIRKRYEALPICKRYYITLDNGQIMPVGICKNCFENITDKKVEKIIKRTMKYFYNEIKNKGKEPEDNKFYKKFKKRKLKNHSLLRKEAKANRKEILENNKIKHNNKVLTGE